ncbi:hypothetical protein LCGC14_1651720 [marine sediment metagenome]|uniref:Uncharacterized protein n=1 Tax=marine sediment metagenome TaxID=412755 RepID=A0A0F9IJ52_9ZZZZ
MSNLEPADKERCQADKPNGQGPFTLGGGHKMVRCTNKPSVIATENKPGEDGQKGSMSICTDCLTKFTKQMPQGYATFTNIK